MSEDSPFSPRHDGLSADEAFGDVLTLPSLVEPAPSTVIPGGSIKSSPAAVGLQNESDDVDILSEDTNELAVLVSAKRSREVDSSISRESESPPKKRLKESLPMVVEEQKEGEASIPKSKKEIQEEERLKMQVLVSHFSEDQLNRYEMFRRAAFPKAAVKRLMQMVTGTSVSQNVVIAMSGIAKVYIGEIVETALDVMEKWTETGPLQPKHLREAVRQIRLKSGAPSSKCRQRVFH